MKHLEICAIKRLVFVFFYKEQHCSEVDRKQFTKMEGLCGILILTLLLLSINGQVLSKDLGNVNIDSALDLMTTGL